MRISAKLSGAVLAAACALVSFVAPVRANDDVIGHGDVKLGACDGSSATYFTITQAEDTDLLGLGFNDKAALLANPGTGQAGVVFTPDNSNLTPNEKAAIQFALANVFVKGTADARRHANLTVCFDGGTTVTIPLSKCPTKEAPLGWTEVGFGPRTLGIRDEDARRLERFSIYLTGATNLIVGNAITYWELIRKGRHDLLGRNFYDNLELKLEDCSILNGCN